MKEKIRKLFSNVWTIPNVLTMIRLILIPVFVILFFSGLRKAALAVFVAASLTDMLDGFLARKLNQITDFGKLFDPLADKLMVLTAMVCQAIVRVFPWEALIIVACKELFMVVGGALMLKRGVVVYSNLIGKTAQVCFIASLTLAFFHDDFISAGTLLFGLTPDILLLWITVVLAVLAMIFYTLKCLRQIRHPETQASGS